MAETQIDSQVLAMLFALLNTKACRREGRFYRRTLKKLPGWGSKDERVQKREKEMKDYWMYLLSQLAVYWFTVDPTHCERILYPSPDSQATLVRDSWLQKCRLIDLTARLKRHTETLADAIAKRDDTRATQLADNLPKSLNETKPGVEHLAEANVKIAANARSLSIFRKLQGFRSREERIRAPHRIPSTQIQ